MKNGGFVCSVAGKRRGKGSSREQSPYAEMMAGIRVVIAENIERIYRENCQNLGVLTSTNFELIERIRAGEAIPLSEFTEGADEITRGIIEHGGLFNYNVARLQGKVSTPPISCHRAGEGAGGARRAGRAHAARKRRVRRPRARRRGRRRGGGAVRRHLHVQRRERRPRRPRRAPQHAGRRPMTLAEKIFARHWVTDLSRGEIGVPWVQPGDAGFVQTDIRFSHEYVTPMSAIFFETLVGEDEKVLEPESVLFFRDHLTFLKDVMPAGTGAARPAGRGQPAGGEAAASSRRSRASRSTASFAPARHGSEAICHSKILESYALPGTRHHRLRLAHPARGRGRLRGLRSGDHGDLQLVDHQGRPRRGAAVLQGGRRAARSPTNVTAKDFMLEILRHPYIKDGHAIGQIIEYAGPAVEALSVDERATMTNMAAEVGAFTGLVAPDGKVVEYLMEQRGMAREEAERLVEGLVVRRGRGLREGHRDRRLAPPPDDRPPRRPRQRDLRGGAPGGR